MYLKTYVLLFKKIYKNTCDKKIYKNIYYYLKIENYLRCADAPRQSSDSVLVNEVKLSKAHFIK